MVVNQECLKYLGEYVSWDLYYIRFFYSITEKSLEEPEKALNHEPTKDQVTEEKTVNEISEETAKVWIL